MQPRATRRRASPRVRRRRAVAAALVAGVVALVVIVSTGSSTHHAPSAHASASSVPAAQPTVRIDAASSPYLLAAARSRAVALADGSRFVLAGGIEAQQATTNSVVDFSPNAGVESFGTLAVPTHDAAAASVGGRLLVFGGGAQSVTDAVQQLVRGGPSTVVAHLPHPRADFGAATIGNTAYLVGGYDGSAPAPDVLATSDGTAYRTVARLATPVRYPAVVASHGRVYAFGGEWNGVASGAVQAVDPAQGRTTVIAHLPAPRTQASAFVVGDAVYVAGGVVGGTPSADILRFDPVTARFTRVGALPAPIADAAAVTVGGAAYVAGGEANTAVSGVDVLRPTTTASTSHLALTRQRPFSGHLLLADRGNNRLIVVDAAKHILWSYPSRTKPAPPGGFYFPDDGFFVDHGRGIISNEEENHTIVRIAYPSGVVQWQYGHPKVTGASAGYLNQPDDAFLLRDGTTTVADAKNCRILFMSADAHPISQIGTTGRCTHDPPRSLGYPNGDTPLANGDFLVSEINGSWISEYTRSGALKWTVHLPITYPSDPQQVGPDLYLVADYARPGGIVEFTREGRIVWTYRPTSGDGMLDHPSLAEPFANGLIGVNDDYRHRVVLIDPATSAIVWQYGATDVPGRGFDRLDTPDGFDLLLPDASTPAHPYTG